ncbi:MAG: single-stranded-DNA-specific exonuclease RecJ [Nitrospina sp.]|nr:single-stranded-DNA-specific exonuclease RecJ [Nitrospina sp.]
MAEAVNKTANESLSLLNRRWVAKAIDGGKALALEKTLGISSVLAGLLAGRGLADPDAARFFLEADLKNLHDPFLMTGMQEAAGRIADAVGAGEQITVFGDYDVDGVTSAALMVHFFRELGSPIDYYLPDRQGEGYGVNKAALKEIRERGTALVITADCGITAVGETEYANGIGLDVIITDHHQVGAEGLPQAVAVLNPHQPGCTYPFKFLSGVGIVFKLAAAVRRTLLERGWDKSKLPNLKQHLDLLTLGTIADLAPLTDENHVMTLHGLEQVRATRKPGLVALKSVAGCSGRIDAFSIGFGLGPRLNAAGRMGKADSGFHLLVSDDLNAAMEKARDLDEVNTQRKETQDWVLKEAEYLVEREVDLERDRVIVLASENFHPGVIGIVASKIVERYHRPAVLIAINEEGVGKGSARSILAFNLHRAFGECEAHLIQFGGHAYAAGLTIEQERIGDFRQAFNAVGHRILNERDLIPEIAFDAELKLSQIDRSFFREVSKLEPFGQLNPSPVFLTRGIAFKNFRKIGKDKTHVRFQAAQERGRIEVIGFNMAHAFAGIADDDRLDIVYQLHRNDFSGTEKLELKLLDMRPVS